MRSAAATSSTSTSPSSPYINATGELKTKPTQHSVKELRALGIQPDAIICRADHEAPDEIKDKVSMFCDVPRRAVYTLATVDNVYSVPLILEDAGLGDLLIGALGLRAGGRDLADWRAMVERMSTQKPTLPIAVVGKYTDLPDAYISVREAIRHAGLFHGVDAEIDWVYAEEVERAGPHALLSRASGVVVPGGFGERGIEGMIAAAAYARTRRLPYLGLCLGMQVMVIEQARNVLGLTGANSTEFDSTTPAPVIDLMPDQRQVAGMGGTMRLGVYPCALRGGTRAAAAYGRAAVQERHRHRFEFNNAYREDIQDSGLLPSGLSPDGRLVEIVEQVEHPFMVGVQFHPEFLSRPQSPHPLFREFVRAAKETLREGAQHPLPIGPKEPA